MINDNMIAALSEIFFEYYESDDRQQKSYKMRKRVKVLFDSIYEQVIKNFFNKRANNEAHALIIINRADKSSMSSYQSNVLECLHSSLGVYSALSDKNYTEEGEDLMNFMENHFTDLILSILSSGFDSSNNARILTKYLED
ncbi:hypothetical protein [Vibrio mytili]|uniref:Uncharacterized protein n=2 Tax=Vibrio mytili TaxID=50718 RepID=A0A0C3HMI5_9VIBR|nr:hypothetical protein [Vibrio mytili]KIN09356.1 hypothetical protein SU60_20125 [Vibrio mytili]